MKPKPLSHKSENTFKFESFNERLDKINISTIGHLKRRLDGIDDNEDISFFALALEKWHDLNCTTDYKEFRQKIGSSLDVQNLVQILHRKNDLVKILIEELKNKESKALNAVLDLVVALARDLQSEFYEFFSVIFKLTVDLVCQVNCVETIEALFVCQTFLLKYLWKPILNDIQDHFNTLKVALKSSKSYVLYFSSEVFSFLLRKSKNPECLFEMIFKSLKEDSDISKGVGRILFETVKGVNKCLNSKAKLFFEIIFKNFLVSDDFMNSSMAYFIEYLVEYCSVDSFKLTWNFFIVDPSQYSGSCMINVIQVMHQVVSYRQCKYVHDGEAIFKNCIKCLTEHRKNSNLQMKTLNLIEHLLNNISNQLSDLSLKEFCKNFFDTKLNLLNLNEIFAFTKKIIQSPVFEKCFNEFCFRLCTNIFEANDQDKIELCLEFLSFLILYKRPRPLYGNELTKLTKYPLQFENANFILKKLMMIISTNCNLKQINLSLIIIANLSPLNNPNDICELISNSVIKNCLSTLSECQDRKEASYLCGIILKSIHALILLKSNKSTIDEINLNQFKEIFSNEVNLESIDLLKALNLFLAYNLRVSNEYKEEIICYLSDLYPILEHNFRSPFRSNRIVSLHTMTLFPLTLSDCSDKSNEDTVFKICLEAELVPIELDQYRERLKHIRKLDCNFVSDYVPTSISELNFDLCPVHFLLGTLYENLSVLWKPIIEVLETYARLTNNRKGFIDILFNHYNETVCRIKLQERSISNAEDCVDFKNGHSKENDNYDHFNHRFWLLKSFELFADIIEPKNREFVELFFSFVDSEVKFSFTLRVGATENLKILSEVENELEQDTPNTKSSMTWKAFFAFMDIFAKFKNPKALYRESELNNLYLNMLLSPNSTVQKHSIHCLLTYNYDFLTKYKENFLRLIDDKSFTSEIHSFTVHDNVDDNIIIADDRQNVIPIFLRVLHGKMIANSGTKVHGKSKIDFLRSIILKVISSFDEKEQIMFMDLIYSSITRFLNSNYVQLFEEIDSFVNVEQFIPFKQFQSYITTLEYLLKHFGCKSLPVMQYMFKILIICSTICTILLSPKNKTSIKDYVIQALKKFRSNCFKVANYFFTQFDQYKFTVSEIDVLFKSLVEPLLYNLQYENLDSPSPLLRLFNVWSENPRYYILLAKHVDPQSNLTPIDAVIKLYSNPKISSTNVSYITTIIENLLSYDTFKLIFDTETVSLSSIEINNFGKPIPKTSDYPEFEADSINFGSVLLIPHIKAILERIRMNYSANVSSNSKNMFTLQEINVLARLSFFVKSPIDSMILSTLLLHSISQNRRLDEDKEVFTLKTLNHLANNLLEENFSEIFQLTIPLFGLIDKPLSRNELAHFLCSLSKKNEDFISLAVLIKDINSYNPRLPEEPDYDLRIMTFKKLFVLLDDFSQELLTQTQLNFIQILLRNCSFFINTYDDMSLKDLSSNAIIKVCNLFKTSNIELFNRFVLNQIFYKIISHGFRQEKESVRHEYVNILLNAIKMFSDKHPVIDQLLCLCNENDDELDFWQNIKHIQLHRRSRALTRLCHDTKLLESLSSRVYMNFLIPFINSFLTDVRYAKNETLLNSTTDALATFLQYCSWYKYDSTLSYYVNGLLNNKIDLKIAIKTISALLEKFSFLRPEDVANIEKQFNAADLKTLSIEYEVVKKKPKQRAKKNWKKNNKKDSKENEKEKEDKNDDPIEKDPNDVLNLTNLDDVEMVSEECAVNLAYKRKIYDSLCKKLLPLLHKCLHQKSAVEHMHDSRADEFPEDEEIKRIPIALAIVKLLKHVQFNENLLEANLSSIFLRLCQFLQSRTESIRETSRSTLIQILQTLGPKYFKKIFFDMKFLFTRGYQRHVFIYTVYSLLSNLTSQLQCGDLDNCMNELIDACHLELFGSLSDEKEVSHIVTKTKEAKKLKGYDIYEILAQFVSEGAIRKMLKPLEELMLETSSHKLMSKIKKAFNKIGHGVVANKFISVEGLMAILKEILSTTLPEVEETENTTKLKPIAEKLPSKVDYMLIPKKSLRRFHQQSKINRSSNSYVLSEFALTCLYYLLKNNRLVNSDPAHSDILEPILYLLESFLHSKDVQVVTLTMSCIHLILVKFPNMSSFQSITPKITSRIFVLLNKYSGVNSENSQLISLCFKTIAFFVNTRMECKLSNEEIAILISYAEKDLENNSQNSTIYFMLKSIISRKFTSKELHVLMEKLLVHAITTDVDSVRTHSIDLSIKYLSEYPIEKSRFKGKIVKLVRQLDYKELNGRMAAITILKSVINYLTYDTIEPIKRHLFLPLSSRLYNEESAEIKKLVADTITKILSKLTPEDLDLFFQSYVIQWISGDDISIKIIASMLCSLYINYEKQKFEPRLNSCLPFISQQLDPTRYTETEKTIEETDCRDEDILIFQHLTFVLNLLKLSNSVQLLTKVRCNEHLNEIITNLICSYTLHSHTWIRHLSCQILGQLFSLFSPESFIHDQDIYKNCILFQNSRKTFSQLCDNLCLVFRDIYNCVEMSEQLVKNLIYISRVLLLFDTECPNEKKSNPKISLQVMIKKILFEMNYEVKNQPDHYNKRILAYKWISAVAVLLGKDKIMSYLDSFLPPLCRQDLAEQGEGIEGEQDKTELINLNKQVLQLLRNIVGNEVFFDHYNTARNQISHRRLERKKQRAIQMITRMDVAVKRKQRRHQKPQNRKKRKLA